MATLVRRDSDQPARSRPPHPNAANTRTRPPPRTRRRTPDRAANTRQRCSATASRKSGLSRSVRRVLRSATPASPRSSRGATRAGSPGATQTGALSTIDRARFSPSTVQRWAWAHPADGINRASGPCHVWLPARRHLDNDLGRPAANAANVGVRRRVVFRPCSRRRVEPLFRVCTANPRAYLRMAGQIANDVQEHIDRHRLEPPCANVQFAT